MNYENTTFMLQISKSGFSQKPPTEVEGACVVNNKVVVYLRKQALFYYCFFRRTKDGSESILSDLFAGNNFKVISSAGF